MKRQSRQKGFSILEALIVVVVIGILGTASWFVYQHNKPKTTEAIGGDQTTNQNSNQQTTTTPTTKTYASGKEKASFKYPSNWTLTRLTANTAPNDSATIQSPSGAITITWNSFITPGFGNESNANYPLHTVIDKTAITGAPSLYVVSGVTTLDGSTYYPWIAVQDSNGILTSGVKGDLLLFTGRHNVDPSTNSPVYAQFSTSGARAHQNSPALTQAQATAWLSSTEAQQAKQIMLSLSDPQP